MRFRIEPRDVPAEVAAKRLGMTAVRFADTVPNLIARGFPRPDPDTGNFDLTAIDRWCDTRNPHLFTGEPVQGARDAKDVVALRIAAARASHGQR
jgi:hypothetical protein